MPQLLLATNNEGKIRELRHLLADCGWELTTYSELGIELSEEETGQTYQENAKLKALAGAAASGLVALADDSGLEIDAMAGELGPRAARFAGADTSYEERFRIILERLKGLPPEKRTARFRCVIAIAEPGGQRVRFAEGTIEGLIAQAPRGEGGFGYDPIFWVPEHSATLAELPPSVKNAISHRARAAALARQALKQLYYERQRRPHPSDAPAGQD
jgi:XTP/dITP diphosphohydrolase